MNIEKYKNFNRGFELVEVLIASSIILIAFTSLVTVYNIYLNKAKTNLNTVKAVYLAEEGIEGIKYLRNQSWDLNISPLSLNTNYYLNFASSSVNTTTNGTYIDSQFDRKITLGSVNRDFNGAITSSGGTLDPDTKLVTVTVAWQEKGATTTKSIATYITNFFDN